MTQFHPILFETGVKAEKSLSKTVFILPVALVLVVALAGRAGAAIKGNFANPVTITASSLDMADFAHQIGEQAGIPLEAAKEVKDRKVTARLRNRPLREVLDGLRSLYGYRLWARKGKYILTAGDYAQRVAQINAQDQQAFVERLENYRKTLLKGPNLEAPINFRQRILARLTPAQIQALLDKRTLEAASFSSLPPGDQDVVREEFSRQKWGKLGEEPRSASEEEIQNSIVRYSVTGTNANQGIIAWVRLKEGNHGSGLTVFDSDPLRQAQQTFLPDEVIGPDGERTASLRVSLPDNSESSKEAPKPAEPVDADSHAAPNPELNRKVTVEFPWVKREDFTGEPNAPLSPSDVAFEAIAEQADVDFLSDSFFHRPLTPPGIHDKPLREGLDLATDYLDYTWSAKGGLLLFRKKQWYESEDREIPAHAARQWLQYWNHRKQFADKPLLLEEVALMAYSLTPEEMGQLEPFLPLAGRLTRTSAVFALYHVLPPDARQKLLSREGIAWKELSVSQKAVYTAHFPPDVREEFVTNAAHDQEFRHRLAPEEADIRMGETYEGKWLPDGYFPTKIAVLEGKEPEPGTQSAEINFDLKPDLSASPHDRKPEGDPGSIQHGRRRDEDHR